MSVTEKRANETAAIDFIDQLEESVRKNTPAKGEKNQKVFIFEECKDDEIEIKAEDHVITKV